MKTGDACIVSYGGNEYECKYIAESDGMVYFMYNELPEWKKSAWDARQREQFGLIGRMPYKSVVPAPVKKFCQCCGKEL